MPDARRPTIQTDVFSHGEGSMERPGNPTRRPPDGGSGKFGRMFPQLDHLEVDERALIELGLAMNEGAASTDPDGDNAGVAAGFTYLGQFIDHDITFDPTSLKERRVDPLALENFRTPALDLDSVYGGGRAVQPYLYCRRPDDTDLFEIGQTVPWKVRGDRTLRALPPFPNDLPRARSGLAIIADPRNDENLIVAQLHLAMLKLHNRVVAGIRRDEIDVKDIPGESVFDRARRLVVWHYQWVVVHDFLGRLIDRDVLRAELTSETTIYDDATYPFIPVEFSMAAYRFGHSMVREAYDFNRVFGFGPDAVTPATLSLLFRFSGRSGSRSGDGTDPVPIPSDWIIDWRRFFDFGRLLDGAPRPTLSRRLDPLLAPTLFRLVNVGNPASDDPADRSAALPVRNLVRGQRAGLPSGQSVAAHYGIRPLGPGHLGDDSPAGRVLRAHGLLEQTPLWFYVLKEAEVLGGGQMLGPVGGRIVAQVFAGLLRNDPDSYLSAPDGWQTTLFPDADITMPRLLQLAGDVNPLGDRPLVGPGGNRPFAIPQTARPVVAVQGAGYANVLARRRP
ncbi:MAG: peroxidase [Chloroflexi bacterium]|nr:peroxidase [Chloroflexota bacterium]